MTREEAISLIKSAQLMLVNPTTNEPVSDLYEAFDMAIKALEQEPCDDVLDKIRVELHATAEMHEDEVYYLREEWIDETIDKYKTESEAAEQ